MYWASFLGVLLGGLLVLVLPLRRARRFAGAPGGAKQQFAQDRQRVIDFMHLMAEALGEGLTLQELRQRIVHASILCTGALSACIFERTAGGHDARGRRGGPFPAPPADARGQPRNRLTTRAKFIEQMLTSEEFPVGRGVVGRGCADRPRRADRRRRPPTPGS